MKLLILYGSTEGQTRKIARFVADRIQAKGITVDVVDAASAKPDFCLPSADAIIVAASVHLGSYQSALQHLVTANRDVLQSIPTAFLSVSLAAAGDADDLQDVKACAERFVSATGWMPGRIEHVAGAFRYTEYDFFKRWIMKVIARQHGQPTDASQDYELTDWLALELFADEFIAQLEG
jgi:menaquinone-dependent protoporphyrinogen oxidase